MNLIKASRVALISVLCILGGAASSSYKSDAPATPAASAQDVTYLNQRLSALEQRLFNIESTINQLRSQAMISQAPSPSVASPSISREEVGLLRTQIDLLQRQMAEVQCGLLKLDQRTLPASAKSQLTPSESAELCRRTADSPVRINAR